MQVIRVMVVEFKTGNLNLRREYENPHKIMPNHNRCRFASFEYSGDQPELPNSAGEIASRKWRRIDSRTPTWKVHAGQSSSVVLRPDTMSLSNIFKGFGNCSGVPASN